MKQNKSLEEKVMVTKNLVKEGYLDVKIPPGNRERKLWKAWQKRWLVSKIAENPCGLELEIYGCPKVSKGGQQPLWTELISPDSARLYRSHSRTHPWAFSIMKGAAVVLHLAAETEQFSQGWMSSLRDALWPPSPIVQVEAAFQDVHRVSLIDDEQTCCCDDLFAAYGHLYIVGEVILLMSTHSGRLIKEWRLEEISSAQVERLDEGKTSGVFSLTLQSISSQRVKKLQFYSLSAIVVAEKISAALKSRQEDKNFICLQKYESGIQELSEFFTFPCDRSSEGVSPLSQNTLKGFKTLSGDLLNCSINSVFSNSAASSSASRSNSNSSSDYSPPVSPSHTIFPALDNPTGDFESTQSQKTKSSTRDLFDNYYTSGAELETYRNSHETDEVYDDLSPLPRYSTTSGIYEDISSLPDSKRASIAETLYEDIEEDQERFTELMNEIMEHENTPPLPPPRNLQNSDACYVTPNKVKRPSTLGLESLSSSISEALSQLKAESTPVPSCKKNFPTGLFKPIKSVKKILGNRRSVKSSPASPSEENAKTDVLLQIQNCECDTKETVITEGEPFLIMDFTDPSEESLKDGSNYLESQTSSTLTSDEMFVPFPELLSSPTGCNRELCVARNQEVKGCESSQSADTSSVTFRSGKRSHQTRSCNSLIVESLKSKYSRHREFLEFLRIGKSRNGSSCEPTHKQSCISRSVSLEPFPCRPRNYCNLSSLSCDSGASSFYAEVNLKHDDLHSEGHSNTSVSERSTLHNPLQHRNSSDYCVMNPAAAPNAQTDCEANIIGHNKMKRKSTNQEWSSSIQMQITEHESLYMDMTRATK